MKDNKIFLLSIFYNVGLFVLIGFCVWYLKSPVPLIGLVAIKQVKLLK